MNFFLSSFIIISGGRWLSGHIHLCSELTSISVQGAKEHSVDYMQGNCLNFSTISPVLFLVPNHNQTLQTLILKHLKFHVTGYHFKICSYLLKNLTKVIVNEIVLCIDEIRLTVYNYLSKLHGNLLDSFFSSLNMLRLSQFA